MTSNSLKEIVPRINMFTNSFLNLNFADCIGYACVVKVIWNSYDYKRQTAPDGIIGISSRQRSFPDLVAL